MPTDLPLRCRCGALRGVALGVSPRSGNRLVCYCDDCQAFAHFLDRSDVLDARGGTDVFQMPPARIRFAEGSTHLACMRLSERGLLRWYAGCCRTPIGNTLATARMPFIGVIHAIMDHGGEGSARDAVLGPPRGHVHGRFALGGPPPEASSGPPLGLILRSVGLLGLAALRGEHRPSPFFDGTNDRPVVEPRVLSAAEREAIRDRVAR